MPPPTNEPLTVLHPGDEEIRVQDRFDRRGPLIVFARYGAVGHLPVDVFLSLIDTQKNPVFRPDHPYEQPEDRVIWHEVINPGITGLAVGSIVTSLTLAQVRAFSYRERVDAQDGEKKRLVTEHGDVPWNIMVRVCCDRYVVWDVEGRPLRRRFQGLTITFMTSPYFARRKNLSARQCQEIVETIDTFNDIRTMRNGFPVMPDTAKTGAHE